MILLVPENAVGHRLDPGAGAESINRRLGLVGAEILSLAWAAVSADAVETAGDGVGTRASVFGVLVHFQSIGGHLRVVHLFLAGHLRTSARVTVVVDRADQAVRVARGQADYRDDEHSDPVDPEQSAALKVPALALIVRGLRDGLAVLETRVVADQLEEPAPFVFVQLAHLRHAVCEISRDFFTDGRLDGRLDLRGL